MAYTRPPPSMPPATADLQTSWNFLEEGIDHIMTKLETGVSYSKYMSLYTVSYNCCTSSRMYAGSDTMPIGNRSGSHIQAKDLYNKLSRYFASHITTIREEISTSVDDEELLSSYEVQWNRYTTGANYTNRLFTYLNKHWVKKEHDEGRKGVYPVNTLALEQWKINLFIPLQQKNKLTNAVLRQIESHRNGEIIDQSLVKKVIDSFVSLGLDTIHPDFPCLDEYRRHFETPFIQATVNYYERESRTFLADHGVSEYLKKVEDRLREEESRVKRYMSATTHTLLMTTCENVLIRDCALVLVEHFKQLLEFDKYYDMQRMHSLLSRIPGRLEPLHEVFEEYVKKCGLAAVQKIVGESDETTEDVDPKSYIDALLDVHKKSVATVERCFKKEIQFRDAVDKAFKEIVNRNAATGPSDSKSSALLVKYIDLLLRKNNRMVGDHELEEALDRAVTIFKFIYDKDVFHSFYLTRLCKRLVHGVSASSDSEESMISKIKGSQGSETFVEKFQKMLLAIKVSKEISEQFQRRMQRSQDGPGINFNVVVVDFSLWPSVQIPQSFTIPAEMTSTYEEFTSLYHHKHTGHRLMWLWNYSKNELKTNYLNQQYILLASTYQTAILLQFNNNDTLSLEELHAATLIPTDLLPQVLAILVKARILLNEETHQYDLNPDFKSKKIRVNLNLPLKAEAKVEAKVVMETVEEDRKQMIQTTIVRIMKTRQTMKHQALIQEVVALLSSRFTPKVPDVKKNIAWLLEKDYMERIDGTKDTYAYVA